MCVLNSLGICAHYPLSATMDVRLIKKSDCLLCPAARLPGDTSTHTAFVEILSIVGTNEYEKFFQEVGEEWIRLGGVPHWSKQWTFLKPPKDAKQTTIFEYIQDRYGENLTKFQETLKWCDVTSDGLFVNSTMKQLLF